VHRVALCLHRPKGLLLPLLLLTLSLPLCLTPLPLCCC
jgi:hypothetical protein